MGLQLYMSGQMSRVVVVEVCMTWLIRVETNVLITVSVLMIFDIEGFVEVEISLGCIVVFLTIVVIVYVKTTLLSVLVIVMVLVGVTAFV